MLFLATCTACIEKVGRAQDIFIQFKLGAISSDPDACCSLAGLIHYATYLSVHPDSTMDRAGAKQVECGGVHGGKWSSLAFFTFALAGLGWRQHITSK
jgi:hypothetical protein